MSEQSISANWARLLYGILLPATVSSFRHSGPVGVARRLQGDKLGTIHREFPEEKSKSMNMKAEKLAEYKTTCRTLYTIEAFSTNETIV